MPLYVKDKNVLPVMEDGDVFKLTIRYEKEGTYRTGIDNASISIKHADKILELIQINPSITVSELMIELSLSESSIRKILARLVESNIVEREGSRKVGKWVIL